MYKKSVTITNASGRSRKFRFLKTVIADNLDSELIQVNEFGIKNMVPGISFNITVTFSPISSESYQFKGDIIFLSYSQDISKYFQFAIPVLCIVISSRISITPTSISFEKMPLWKVENNCCKTFKVYSREYLIFLVKGTHNFLDYK